MANVLWCFYPFLAFLYQSTWSHDVNIDCAHLYHVITWTEMGSYTLIVGVLKYFLFWGVLSAFNFILCGFCPIMLLSMLAFLYLPKWSHEENVNCPHLYHVITWKEMGSYTLNVEALEYFLFWGGFVRFQFYPLGLLSYNAFVHFGFSLSAQVITWGEC